MYRVDLNWRRRAVEHIVGLARQKRAFPNFPTEPARLLPRVGLKFSGIHDVVLLKEAHIISVPHRLHSLGIDQTSTDKP